MGSYDRQSEEFRGKNGRSIDLEFTRPLTICVCVDPGETVQISNE
jgi:hypothetical protein